MTPEQYLILALLGTMMAAFIWGRLRHDVVALAALLAAVVAGLVPAETAFAGFGHPAVITVACVLVLSRGLQVTGAVDWLSRRVLPEQAGPLVSMAALCLLGAGLSAFMNNVGAMALLMPVAVQMAARHGLGPGQILMPLAFATILGGMVTLIGTPPNLIVAGFRPDTPFAMFDFAWIGLPVALAGVAFIVLGARGLVPHRLTADADAFRTEPYLTEVRVPEGAPAEGRTLRQVEEMLEPAEGQITAHVRGTERVNAPGRGRRAKAGDILVIRAHVANLAEALGNAGLKLAEDDASAWTPAPDPEVAEPGASGDEKAGEDESKRDSDPEIVLREYVILPDTELVGRTARGMQLRARHGLNLLGVARSGRRPQSRLRTLALRAGDVVLLQGRAEALSEFAATHGCVPLAARELRLPDGRKALTAGGVMVGAVALAATGLVPAAVAFALGLLAVMVLRVVPLRDVYTSIDWPVIVLLAALIPVAGAMEETGTAALIAGALVAGPVASVPLLALAVVLVVTMVLSDVMNNAATAAVMSPVALGVAQALGVAPDPLLMAVAIGASCAFLTPIGHQNNTLILGPGGFAFGDYWRLGLPLQGVILLVSLPLLPLVWPF